MPTGMQCLVDRSVLLSPLLLEGHGWQIPRLTSVSQVPTMCSVVVDVQLPYPVPGTLLWGPVWL